MMSSIVSEAQLESDAVWEARGLGSWTSIRARGCKARELLFRAEGFDCIAKRKLRDTLYSEASRVSKSRETSEA